MRLSAQLSIVVIATLLTWTGCKNSPKTDVKTIGVTQIASHPSLDSVREGLMQGLREAGWSNGDNLEIKFRNANRDPGLALPIAQDFARSRVDVIVPITTPSALAASQATKHIPIIFGGVTDPVGVGLVSNLNHPGGNVTGTSDRWPFDHQIRLFKQLLPGLSSLGMLYAPGDNVSTIAINELREICPRYGITLHAVPVSSSQDLYSAARRLLVEVDALYTGLDTLIVENLDSIIKAGREARKPIFAGDEGTVRRGALATYGIDMKELGRETAKLVDRVLKGEKPGDIPVTIVNRGYPIINERTLKSLGLSLPGSLKSSSTIVTH